MKRIALLIGLLLMAIAPVAFAWDAYSTYGAVCYDRWGRAYSCQWHRSYGYPHYNTGVGHTVVRGHGGHHDAVGAGHSWGGHNAGHGVGHGYGHGIGHGSAGGHGGHGGHGH